MWVSHCLSVRIMFKKGFLLGYKQMVCKLIAFQETESESMSN